MAAVTRLGLHGGPRSPYGSFAGKEEQALAPAITNIGRVNALQVLPFPSPRQAIQVEGIPAVGMFGAVAYSIHPPARTYQLPGIGTYSHISAVKAQQTIGMVDAVLLMSLMDD